MNHSRLIYRTAPSNAQRVAARRQNAMKRRQLFAPLGRIPQIVSSIGCNMAAPVGLLLAISLLGLFPARADIFVHADASRGNDGANIDYTTGGGLTTSSGGAGGFTYSPDTLPGHLTFSVSASVSGTAIVDQATADLPHGLLRASSNVGAPNGFEICGSDARFNDTITFHNSTGQPATVTFSWTVEGSLAATEGSKFCRASYTGSFVADGPGLGWNFNSHAGVENSPAANSAEATASGWESSSVEPISGGFGGARNTGTMTVPPGGRTVSISARVVTGASGDAPAGANFGNTGKFELLLPAGVSFTSEQGTLSTGSRLANISTRARVLGGDNVSIAGFIITGNVPKKVIVLGIGPSLSGFVPNPMPNPTLQLNRDNTVLTTNDDWKDTQQTEIQNSGLAPTNNLESAIVRTLDPGNYTAILRDKNNAAGIGVVQVYDLDTAADSKLANISTRAFIEGGDNVLFAGIIGGGNGSQPKVLITARGPSLTPFGVSNAVPDPFLELHDKDGALIASNDDWQSDQKAEIEASGAAPPNSKESALLATLRPAQNYTAIVKDANDASGVALVEVYHLQ